MSEENSHIAFADARCLVEGPLGEVLSVLKGRFDEGRGAGILVFELSGGRQVDFELHLPLAELLERYAGVNKGPGRPRLGVISREISLLPRHWEWLEQQPQGISAALRRLVEHAMKHQPGHERARRLRAATSQVLSALAGNRPHYEEASRALFAGDVATFAGLVERWPKDIREFALRQVEAAAHAEAEAEPAVQSGRQP